ncbi:MAG: hypothetical protein SVY53_10610 [Chloroflexota bacterium]|nr:hypothetical protein [Chloroflexota bacterium]
MDDRRDAEAYVKEQCQELEKALSEGDLKQASKLRYRIKDLHETMGGMEGLDKYLDRVGERLVEARKKAREEARAKV